MMFKATMKDKDKVVNILVESFTGNKSVERFSGGNAAKTKALMEYSFTKCMLLGKVYLSRDLKGCALIIYPDNKKTSFKLLWNDAVFIAKGVGFKNLKQVLADQALINQKRAANAYHVWYIGVKPPAQRLGLGTYMLKNYWLTQV